jgi:hypothetical protein
VRKVEQIQFNYPVKAATASQGVIGESVEKSDLFPQMLKEQKNLEPTESGCDKKQGSQDMENDADKENQKKQPLSFIDGIALMMQEGSVGSSGAKMNGLHTVVQGVNEGQNPLGEEANNRPVLLPLVGLEGSLSETNSTAENGNRAMGNRLGMPAQTVSMASTTEPEMMKQEVNALQTNNLLQKDLSSSGDPQNVATLFPEGKTEPTRMQHIKAAAQSINISADENVLKPPVQLTQGTALKTDQAAFGEMEMPVTQKAATFGQTNTPLPENIVRTEIPQPAKILGQGQSGDYAGLQNTVCTETAQLSKISGQDQSQYYTGLQNTAGTNVSGQPQSTTQVIIPNQSQSPDYSGSQNMVVSEVLGQTQNAGQIKASDQTQSAVRNQMIYQINANFDKGKQEFEMQLYPKELGKVNVKMTVEHNKMIVEICAANSKAQSIILANADDIKAMLQSQANREVQIALPQEQKLTQQSLHDGNANQQNGYSSGEQQAEEKEEHREMDTESFLNALHMFSGKNFVERSQEHVTG